MALKISGVTTHGKRDVLLFNPLELVPLFSSFTGRKDRSEEAIDAMAASLLLHGQEQPFVYRKNEKGEPIPVSGHTRILAAARISERSMGMYSPSAPFMVAGFFRQLNEMEAMIHTFVENADETRTPLNPVDKALFVRLMAETWGLTDAQIAEKLGKSPNDISRLRKVLDLDPQTQSALANGDIKLAAAVGPIHKMAPAARAEAIAKAKESGKASGPAIARAARDAGVDAPRTDADFKAWMKSAAKKVPARGVAFLAAITDFRAGRVSERELTDMLVDLVGGD